MKRFFLFLLAFVVLMGSITCNADDNDVIVSIDLEEDDNDLVVEEIEEPVDEVEFTLGAGSPDEIDLGGQEDAFFELQDESSDILFLGEQAEEVAANSNIESNEVKPENVVIGDTSNIVPLEGPIEYSDIDDSLRYHGAWVWPLLKAQSDCWINQNWGACGPRNIKNGSSKHHGVDINPVTTKDIACAARAGTAYTYKDRGARGNTVIVDHGDGYYTVYQHLSRIIVQSGSTVKAKQELGYCGVTGLDPKNGVHLHFEILFCAYGGGNQAQIDATWNPKEEQGGYQWGTNVWCVIDPQSLSYVDDLVKADSINLSTTSISLNISKGETKTISATILPENTSDKRVKWESSNLSVATVDQSGRITPVAPGVADIVCSTLDGSEKNASCKVTVTNFKLNKENLDMYIGQTFTLEGEIGKANVDCSFKSSNSKVVSVDKKGKLTAKKAGKATITATAAKKQGTATCTVTVHPKPKKVSIKQGSSKTLNIGDSLALSITYAPKDALAKVTWKSSDKKVATVSSDGTVTAKKEGTATITAKVSGMKKGGSVKKKIKITVTDPNKPTGISISSPSKTVEIGETLQLSTTLKPKTAQSDVSWKSSNTKIAKVSKKGLVTPVKVGKVTITATAAKKSPKGKTVSATIKLTVKKSSAPESISVGTSKKSMYVGDKWSLDYKIKPSGAKASLTFSSSDESVATVSKKGVINALKKGTTTITVKTQNNKKASCKVTVLSKPKIQLDKEKLSLTVGDTYFLSCIVSGGNGEKISFSSSNQNVATVDKNGMITAVGEGRAVVSATTSNTDAATCEVTVNKPAKSNNDLSVFLDKDIEDIRKALNDPFDKVVMRKQFSEDGPYYTAYKGNNGIIICVYEGNMKVVAIKIDGNTSNKYSFYGINPSNTFVEVRQILSRHDEYESTMTLWGDSSNPKEEGYYFSENKMIDAHYDENEMYLVLQYWEPIKSTEYF